MVTCNNLPAFYCYHCLTLFSDVVTDATASTLSATTSENFTVDHKATILLYVRKCRKRGKSLPANRAEWAGKLKRKLRMVPHHVQSQAVEWICNHLKLGKIRRTLFSECRWGDLYVCVCGRVGRTCLL